MILELDTTSAVGPLRRISNDRFRRIYRRGAYRENGAQHASPRCPLTLNCGSPQLYKSGHFRTCGLKDSQPTGHVGD